MNHFWDFLDPVLPYLAVALGVGTLAAWILISGRVSRERYERACQWEYSRVVAELNATAQATGSEPYAPPYGVACTSSDPAWVWAQHNTRDGIRRDQAVRHRRDYHGRF